MNKHALLARSETAGDASAKGDAWRYWAFLSYSHVDADAAQRLHRQLEIFRVPRQLVGAPHPLGTIPKRVIPVFRDRQELAASSDLGREIKEALGVARYMVVLCSPDAARSRWVDQEVRDFKRLHGEDRVLAAIVGGEPFAKDEANECFPLSLRQKVDRKGKLTGRPAEPIAADLRDSGDGWHDGVLKLVAGMLDVGLDDLVQREQLRRQKRMTAIVGASLLGMAFTTGLSVVAINARDAARDERREAEGLAGFMLGDLRAELEPIGELDSLDKVAQRVLDYYDRRNKRDLTDDQLGQRSKALALLAEIALMRGDLNAASTYYAASMRGSAELIRRYPDDAQRLFDHAQSVFWVGDLASRRGQLDDAMAAFQTYAQLADRMVAIDPAKRDWQMEVQYAAVNVGFVQQRKRDYAAATRSFARALASIEKVAAAEPANQDYQKNLTEALAWLADAELAEGHLSDALSHRERQVAILDEASRRHRDVDYKERLFSARASLGHLLASTGSLGSAIEQLTASVAGGQGLLATEPGNLRWQQKVAAAQVDRALVLLAMNDVEGAARDSRAAYAIVSKLVATNKDDTGWQRLLTRCLLAQSRVALRQASNLEAQALAARAVEVARMALKDDPVGAALVRSEGLLLQGMAQARDGDRTGAQQAWSTALADWPKGIAESPREKALRAELLDALGQRNDARQIRRALAETGYRLRV